MSLYGIDPNETADVLDAAGHEDAASLMLRLAARIDELEAPPPAPQNAVDATRDLIAEMAKVHLRAHSHPLPEHPAALHWQITAGFYAALAARMLQHLYTTDQMKASEITQWCNGALTDPDGDVDAVNQWIASAVAPSPSVFYGWVDQAQQEAQKAGAQL